MRESRRAIIESRVRKCYTRCDFSVAFRPVELELGKTWEVECGVLGRTLRVNRPRRAIAVVCAVLVLLLVVGGMGALFEMTQPPAASRSVAVLFEVHKGEPPSDVATRLEHDGLIRSAWLFGLVAHLPNPVKPGIYRLSSAMNMTTVATKLAAGRSDLARVTIPPALRATQYPAIFAGLLPHVTPQDFLRIATSGMLPNGETLSTRYWYVMPKASKAEFALEGYLLPGTYLIDTSANASDVVEALLDAFGARLCPGSDAAQHTPYDGSLAQCKAHGAQVPVGTSSVSIFGAMEQQFATQDDRLALYDTVTLASIVAREAATPADESGVAAVYANRYHAALTSGLDPSGDPVAYLNAPSTAQYGRDSDQPPPNGRWWAALGDSAAAVDPESPFNTAVTSHIGLPPGPIAAPDWGTIGAVAVANSAAPSPNYYVANICGQMAYAASASQNMGIQVKAQYESAHRCQSALLAVPLPPVAGQVTIPSVPAELPSAQPAPATTAAADVLLDPQSGQVYLAQNADAERAMASTTKMMTALVAITYGNLDEPVTVGPDIAQLAGTGASTADLRAGDVLTLRDLLYGLMLPSGDDAAIVIADTVGGSQAGFVYLMNDEARLLGMKHTHYVNVHGLDADGHFSSAGDLARLAGFALRNQTFANVVATPTYALAATPDHQAYTWTNTDVLLFPPVYPGILGVKTGYTGQAYYCLVFAARGPTGMLVGVVLGEPDEASRFTDARALLDWGFSQQARINWLLRRAGLRTG